MTYTEKELDQFLHGISMSLLSKESAQHWRYDEETAKEIEWLEVLERKVRADKADRKTEPTHDLRTKTHECVKDTHDKTEPTISKMEQVDKDINVRSKEPQTNKDFKVTYTCSFTDCKNFGFNEKCIECKRKQSEARLEDEPPTDCKGCKHWKGGCDIEFPICKRDPVEDEPIIYGDKHNCIMTMFGECSYNETGCGSCAVVEKVRNALDKYEPKDEPLKTTEYCNYCNHKGCENCIANNLDDYCVPSNFEEAVRLEIERIRKEGASDE